MAHLTGVFQRGSAFYLRIVLPKGHPLTALYRNGRFVKSLGVCSHREALQRGLAKRAEVLYGFVPVVQLPELSPVAPLPRSLPWLWLSQPATVVVELKAPLTLRGVYEKWKVSKAPSTDSENACLRAVVLFEECLGGKIDLHTLTRAQGDTFRAWLLTKGATSKTSRDRFTWVKSLLKYATRDLEALSKSPWEGLGITYRTIARRRPWSPDELTTLFADHFKLRDAPQVKIDASPLHQLVTAGGVLPANQAVKYPLHLASINSYLAGASQARPSCLIALINPQDAIW